ncbi:MAG: pyridoxal phosphate-dependent aminotransferase [Nanoarchaeota archaeon]
MKPKMSAHFEGLKPSATRIAQIMFEKRDGDIEAVNVAIGNVSLPMHPAMQQRIKCLPRFSTGVVPYCSPAGYKETKDAFLNIISSCGHDTSKLHVHITDGGSAAMEYVILGVCGPAGSTDQPLMLIDASYTNYHALARRTGRAIVTVTRELREDGTFTLPDFNEMDQLIRKEKPNALVVIPYDNPTGHFLDQDDLVKFAELCVVHNIWMISDEAYREMHYVDKKGSSIWGITEKDVPGIEGRRISIESASKMWNACGIRVGALVTDNQLFHEKGVAESTGNLCSNVVGQEIFSAIADVPHVELHEWYQKQRAYYKNMLTTFTADLRERLPGIIVSSPDASLYSVVDVRKIAKPGFKAMDFVMYCAEKGSVEVEGKKMTLLVAPMAGFYKMKEGEKNPGQTQMRIAYVVSPEKIKLVPRLFTELFKSYESTR